MIDLSESNLFHDVGMEEENDTIVENDKVEMLSYGGASIASAKEQHDSALEPGVDLPSMKVGCEKTILVN